jgi:homogentisate 1,2-dioxygenase
MSLFPQSPERLSRPAYCDLSDGTFEEEFARRGFSGPASHLYHQDAPTEGLQIECELEGAGRLVHVIGDGRGGGAELVAPVLKS